MFAAKGILTSGMSEHGAGSRFTNRAVAQRNLKGVPNV
jgi:hypothetical protein